MLLHGGAVVTVGDTGQVLDPGWVLVEDDLIVEVGGGEPPSRHLHARHEVLDVTGGAVLPGFVNAHTHLFQTFFRGLADDKPLLDWLRDCIWPGAVHLDAESAHLAALVGLIENLRSGATSVIDHQYVHVDETIDDAVARAADELGVRLLLARGWADRNYEPRLMEPADVVIERTTALREAWLGHPRIRVELAPLIPWGCSDEAMRRTTGLARSWGAGTHIHCAETEVEVEMSLDERGRRHVEWLDDLGVLGPDVQLAHSIWLDDGELDLIAERGAVVVSCPVSNMYLASGVPRLPDMRARGIAIALASDGPGSNNRQDMFEVLKATVLLQKVTRLDPVVLQPENVLHMACRGGARAFGMGDALGAVEPGRKADLVVVDLRSAFVAPVHRVPSAVVYTCTPADVRTVLVDGRVVVRDGHVTAVDERAVLEAADEACARVMSRAGLRSRLAP